MKARGILAALFLVPAMAISPIGCIAPPPAKAPAAVDKTVDPRTQAVIVWPGKRPAEAYKVGEIRMFEFVQGGQLIGRSWGRYAGPVKGDPSQHRFETRIEIAVPGRGPIRSDGEIVLDTDGALVRGFERSDAAELRYERKGEAIEISDGSKTDSLAYDPVGGDAVMAHSAILHEELMLGLRRLDEGGMSWRLVSVSGGPPTQWEGQVEQTSSDPPRAVVTTSLGETITLDDGRITRIDVPGSGLEVKASQNPVWPSWEIEGPARLAYELPAGATFERREVELPGKPGEPALHGEVLVPTTGKAPYPAFLYVSGSGQEDRYGFAGPPPVDLGSHEITDALANAGFVVIRFDERGKGKSDDGPLSFEGQVEDARRAFRTLLVQPEVNPDKIVIAGHGEGGIRALAVAISHPKEVVGVALLAAPGRPYREVFLHQAEISLQQLPPQMREQAREEQLEMLETIERGDPAPPELEGEAQWIREMLAQDPAKLIGATPGKLWFAQGLQDFEVDPEADLAALIKAAKSHKKKPKVTRYPKLDHLFKYEPGSSTPARYLDTSRNVDVDFLEDLVEFSRASAK